MNLNNTVNDAKELTRSSTRAAIFGGILGSIIATAPLPAIDNYRAHTNSKYEKNTTSVLDGPYSRTTLSIDEKIGTTIRRAYVIGSESFVDLNNDGKVDMYIGFNSLLRPFGNGVDMWFREGSSRENLAHYQAQFEKQLTKFK